MSIELWMLFWVAVWALVQIGVASTAAKMQTGIPYSVGPRDEPFKLTGVAGRLDRAQRNFLETLPVFIAAVVLVEFSETSGDWSRLGAQAYFWGRVAYFPAYASGVRWLRTVFWQIAGLGLAAMLLEVVI